jgi:uncharacterized protein YeaO (DUF488 family)
VTLTVHTARVSYDGADRLDVTRKSAGPDGIVFAPSWAILGPALKAREVAEWLLKASLWEREAAARIEREAWEAYVPAYLAEMRESWRANRHAWHALLARESVTLVCYCTDPERCHRTLLAGILAKLGATVAGERGSRG